MLTQLSYLHCYSSFKHRYKVSLKACLQLKFSPKYSNATLTASILTLSDIRTYTVELPCAVLYLHTYSRTRTFKLLVLCTMTLLYLHTFTRTHTVRLPCAVYNDSVVSIHVFSYARCRTALCCVQ